MTVPRLSALAVDAPMRLWLADVSEPPCGRSVGWLHPDELARAARFRRGGDRSRYLAAHVALRLVVERSRGTPPERQRFGRDALGRWDLADRSPWRLSLSYAGGTALIGLAHGHAIGIDMEAARAIDDADELARLHLDPDERRTYRDTPDRSATHAFLRAWTRKEACLKAIGTGLRVAPSSLHTGFRGRGGVIVGGDALEFDSFEVDGHFAAWARVR